jgi:hypothetical protein
MKLILLICNKNCVWFDICLDAKDPRTRVTESESNCDICIIKEAEE